MRVFLDNLRFMIRSFCGRSPLLIQFIAMVRGFDDNVCSERSDIVIEAFPRSANTYCVAAFRTLSNDQLSIASHMHAAAQLQLAQRLKKPALLIVREPIDAIASLSIRRPLVKKSLLIKEYIAFHKKIYPLVNKGCLAVISFDSVVNNKKKLLEVAQDLLGDNVGCCGMSDDEFDRKVVALVEEMEQKDSGGSVRETHVARPSKERIKIKKQVMDELFKDKELMDEAQSVYTTMINLSDQIL
jgi:hypothetical protein